MICKCPVAMVARAYRLVITLILLFGAYGRILAEESLVHGGRFYKGIEMLKRGDYRGAMLIFSKLQLQNDFPEWGLIYLGEASLGTGDLDYARRVVSSIKPDTLAFLFRRKIEIEAALRSDKKVNIPLIRDSIQKLKKHKILALHPGLLLLDALVERKLSRYSSCVRKLQWLRERYPHSLAAYKAYSIQKDLFHSGFQGADAMLTPDFRLDELRILTLQGLFEDAYRYIKEIKKAMISFRFTDQRRKYFKARLNVLKGLHKKDELNSLLLEGEKSKDSKIRAIALKESILSAWNRNDYDAAYKYLSKLTRYPVFAAYIKARISEEKRDFANAISNYKVSFNSPKNPHRYHAGLRLAWLQVKTGKNNAALKVLNRLKGMMHANYYDRQSVLYWHARLSHFEGNKEGDIYQDPRLYYYWLVKGRSVTRPDMGDDYSLLEPMHSSPLCRVGAAGISDVARAKLLKLQRYGLYDILRMEVNYLLKNRKDTLSSLISRARLLSDLGGVSEGIRELRSNSEVYALIEKRCLKDVMEILYPSKYMGIINREAKRNGIDPLLLLAIIRTESAFNPMAVSRSGAQGLMQLMPKTAELEGFSYTAEGDKKKQDASVKNSGATERIFVPAVNIALGAKHLKRLFGKYGKKWHLVIAAYNAGSEAVDRWLERYGDASPELWVEFVSYKETRNYIKKVLGAYWTYKFLRS